MRISATTRTCAACGSVDGTVVSRKDYEPGVTVPPFHPGCRGTTCPYFDDMDDGKRIARNAEGNTYHVPANTTYEQWKEMQEGEKMSRVSDLLDSAGNIVRPTPGGLISKEDLSEFADAVKKRGYRFVQKVPGVHKAEYGGFENYRGDISQLYTILDEFDKSKKIWPERVQRKGLLLGYCNFENNEDFAKSIGRSVFFNSQIYDDASYLAESYAQGVKAGHFVFGTDTKAIPWHELGHVLMRDNEYLENRLIRAIKKRGENFLETALQLTSEYGIIITDGKFKELLPELLSAGTSVDDQIREAANDVLKEVLHL